jgi:hypothetical protein
MNLGKGLAGSGVRVVVMALMIITILGGILFFTYRNFLPETPPSYIKSVTAYKEGSDGMVVYLIFADEAGGMTTAKGDLTVDIVEIQSKFDLYSGIIKSETVLFSRSNPVDKSMFIKTKVGIGAFEHEVIMIPLGRIPYSSFSKMPSEMAGEVRAVFHPDSGFALRGDTTIFF